MANIVFNMFEPNNLAKKIAAKINSPLGIVNIEKFPDNETKISTNEDIQGKNIIIVDSLDYPDTKFLALTFFANHCKDKGANKIILITPYLPYMRQDIAFNQGDIVTSRFFAKQLSSVVDTLITVAPHLHRYKSLNEIYSIPCFIPDVKRPIAHWISKHIKNPLIIGPDSESQQWVEQIANLLNVPWLVLNKTRLSPSKVKIEVPNLDVYNNNTFVIVDDMASTANSLSTAINNIRLSNANEIICIIVHGLFIGNSYKNLSSDKNLKIVSTNSINHITNQIDLADEIANTLKPLIL